MAIIKYSGTFQKEIDMFQEHDNVVVEKLNKIANHIGELNNSWNDDESHKYLSTFNDVIEELKGDLDKSHLEIARYFNQIQDLLDKFGTHSHFELNELPSINMSAISASNGDGSISIDEDQVRSILSEMKDCTTFVIGKCEDFKPQAVSMEGSSDDVYLAVQSNLDAARDAYKVIETPLQKMNNIVETVLDDYAKRSAAIIDAVAK